jgi:uncharacterized protein (DUF362 family)
MIGKEVVSIVKSASIADAVTRAVGLCGGMGQLIRKGNSVLIKPNVKNPSPPGYGVVTDPRVVAPLVDLLREAGAGRIVIAEGAAYPSGAYDTFAAFEFSGYKRLAQEKNVELVDLNSYDSVDLKVPNGTVLDRVRVGRSVTTVDVVINVPVLKTHTECLFSGCLKNWSVGIAAREEKKLLHRVGIHDSIVDVHMAVTPSFNVVDAIVALEGDGPNLPPGKSKSLGLVLAGANPVSVDAVAASIMGITPREVKHLVKAEGRGLGTADLERITVLGERIGDVRSPFLMPRLRD